MLFRSWFEDVGWVRIDPLLGSLKEENGLMKQDGFSAYIEFWSPEVKTSQQFFSNPVHNFGDTFIIQGQSRSTSREYWYTANEP